MDLAEIKEEVAYAATTFHCANSTTIGILQHCRTLIAKVEELEAECKERVAEKIEWLGGRGTLQAEVTRLAGIVSAMEEGCYVCQHPKRVDELTCQKNALQQVVREREEQITRLQSSLTLSREEGRREGMERAAAIAETVYADQELAIRGTGFDIAAAIRSEAKGERK